MMPNSNCKRCPNPPRATQQPHKHTLHKHTFGIETLICITNENIITKDLINFKPFSNNVWTFLEHEIPAHNISSIFSLNFEH